MTDLNSQRLASASACRYCGVTSSEATRIAEFRVCRRCQPIAGDHGRLWSAITGDTTITSDEGYWLTTEGLLTNPAYFVTAPETFWATGSPKPWAHLRPGLAEDARSALRRHRDDTGIRRHKSGPCGLCGVRRDDGWTVPTSERGRPICGACARVLARVGWPTPGTNAHDDATTAACLGWDVFIGLGRRVPVTTYAEWEPDGDGYDAPWGHVPDGSRSEARIRLADASTIRRLTPDERGEHARRAEAAAAQWVERAGIRPDPIRLA